MQAALTHMSAAASPVLKKNTFICIFQEVVTTHEITNVCCVVRDTSNPKVFGYVTTTETGKARNMSHVFTADTEVCISILEWSKF